MLGDLTMSCCDPMYFAQSQWTWLVKETLEPVAKNVCSSHIYARLRITTVCCLNWNSDLCYNFVSFIR